MNMKFFAVASDSEYEYRKILKLFAAVIQRRWQIIAV